jgi:hypothetical protein
MRLRVKYKGHNHRGVELRPGDEFDGTETLLANMPDRFEAVTAEPVAQEVAEIEAPARKRGRPRKVKPNANATDSE